MSNSIFITQLFFYQKSGSFKARLGLYVTFNQYSFWLYEAPVT